MHRPTLSEGSLIRSTLFARYHAVVFGLSTRLGGVSRDPLSMNLSFNVGDDPEHVRVNRSRFFSVLNVREDRIAFQRQIHGDNVINAIAPGMYDDCDALVTFQRDLFLAVSVADCVPI